MSTVMLRKVKPKNDGLHSEGRPQSRPVAQCDPRQHEIWTLYLCPCPGCVQCRRVSTLRRPSCVPSPALGSRTWRWCALGPGAESSRGRINGRRLDRSTSVSQSGSRWSPVARFTRHEFVRALVFTRISRLAKQRLSLLWEGFI